MVSKTFVISKLNYIHSNIYFIQFTPSLTNSRNIFVRAAINVVLTFK